LSQSIGLVSILVKNYDEAIGAQILLAKASNDQQAPFIGNQAGGRVFLFLYTADFERDYAIYQSRGVKFVRGKVQEPYGTVAVFADLYGNQWDLIELVADSMRDRI